MAAGVCHADGMDTSPGATLTALSGDIAATVERTGGVVVAVEARDRIGASGFFIKPQTIVTADHALESDDVDVVYAGGRVEKARIVGRDPSTDIAIVTVPSAGPAPLDHAAEAAVRTGAIVLAVARDDDGDVAATMGVIGTTGDAWRTWRGGEIDRFIRPDLSLYPRFSGSPLVDAAGRLVGMNTWGLSRRQSLTVPVATIERIAALLGAHGRIASGYLGVAMQSVELPAALGGGSGVIVLGVAPGSPAEHAGAMVGDVITSLRGRRVGDSDAIQALLDAGSIGVATTLGVVRGGIPRELSVTIAERPHRDDD
jgi:S1-C subfamily serine protease